MSDTEEAGRAVAEKEKKKLATTEDDDDDDDDDEEEDDDDDEEDEEEEEEDEEERHRASRKKRRRRRKGHGFILEEAEVDDDDEEDEPEQEEGFEEFIKEHKAREKYAADEGRLNARDVESHRRLQQMIEADDEEAIESYYRNKYATDVRGQYAENRSTQEISQQALKPTINDPSLWLVKCRQGEEKVTLMQLMRKFIALSGTDHPLLIKSVIVPEGIRGKIYIEAVRQGHVKQAIEGMANLRVANWEQKMVPRNEMEAVLNVVPTAPSIRKGQWVRLKRGLYRDDLATVTEVDNAQNRVTLRLIPRIDFQRLIDKRNGMTDDANKRKRNFVRPAQGLFSHEKAQECGFEVNKEYQNYLFCGERYDKSGFLIKAFPANSVIVEGVKPSIAELEKFEQTPEGVDIKRVVDGISESNDIRAEERFQPGDTVVVKEGHSLQGVRGVVTHISDDEKVIVKATQEDLQDKPISFEAQWLRKSFNSGDHVRVMRGRYEGDTGLVVSVTDKNEVIVCSDLTMHEMTLFPDDLQKCTEKATGVDRLGHFTYGDLVQLDPTTVGVIVRMERELIHALNIFGRVVTVKPQAINKKQEQKFAMALDADNNNIKARDSVSVIDGAHAGKVATVKHVFRQYVFLHSKLVIENGGIFVCRAKQTQLSGAASLANLSINGSLSNNDNINGHLGLVSGSGGAPWQSPAASHTPMYHAPRTIHGDMYASSRSIGSGGMQAPPRVDALTKHLVDHPDRLLRDERIIGLPVRVAVGQYKGQRGLVKDATADIVRIELHGTCRTITVARDRVLKQNANQSLAQPSSFASSYTQGSLGGKTPSYNAFGRTPGPDQFGRTPAASRTPGYDDGGRTPRVDGYDMGGRTPHYGDMGGGGRSSRIPGGGVTPGYDASKSPGYALNDSNWNMDDELMNKGGPTSVAPPSASSSRATGGGASSMDIRSPTPDDIGMLRNVKYEAGGPKSVAPLDSPAYPKTPAAMAFNMPPPESPALPPRTPMVSMGMMMNEPESPFAIGSVGPPMTPHLGGGGNMLANPSPSGYTPLTGNALPETPSGIGPSPYGSSIGGSGIGFTPSGDAGAGGLDAAASSGDWVSEGLEVTITNHHEDRSLNNKTAEVRSVTGSMCTLYVPSRDKVVTVLNNHVSPVAPSASQQKVRIIVGEDREHTAMVISYDPPDCVLKVEGHDSVSMLPIRHLCKYFSN